MFEPPVDHVFEVGPLHAFPASSSSFLFRIAEFAPEKRPPLEELKFADGNAPPLIVRISRGAVIAFTHTSFVKYTPTVTPVAPGEIVFDSTTTEFAAWHTVAVATNSIKKAAELFITRIVLRMVPP
jgi:hypothetical protein